MIQALVSSVLTIVTVLLGVWGGRMLTAPEPSEVPEALSEPSKLASTVLPVDDVDLAPDDVTTADLVSASKPNSEPKAKAEKPPEPVSEDAETSPDYFPIRFSRPFVIPITEEWQTKALVVVSLDVELHNDVVEEAGNIEERLRDRIMTSLLSTSHLGGFDESIPDAEVSALVAQEARNAVETMMPGNVGKIYVREMMRRSL